MIKLNDRLQIIAERLKDEKTMADIGTDHGFLPVFLLQSGQCLSLIHIFPNEKEALLEKSRQIR